MIATQVQALFLFFSFFTVIPALKAVTCIPIDEKGKTLTESKESGDVVTCTYQDAEPCTYFLNGSLSSGSSSCPQGQPQDKEQTTISLALTAESFPLTQATATVTQPTKSFNPFPTITNFVSLPGIAITGPIISLSLGSVALVTPTTDSKFPPDSVKTTITLTSSSNSAVVFTTFTSTSTPATKSPTATLVVTPTMFVTITSTDASSVTAPSNGAASNSHLVSGHTTAGMMGLLGVILAVF